MVTRRRWFLAVVSAVVMFAAVPSTQAARAFSFNAPPNFVPLVKATLPSVVNISSARTIRLNTDQIPDDPFLRILPRERRVSGLGSGVIVSQDGYILTNRHVIANMDEIKVTLSDRREFKGKIIGTDPRTDLAVIKIAAPVDQLHPIEFGASSELKVGQKVLAKVLSDKYGFKVTLLTNPARLDIINALDEFREKLGATDNLLIYYAGHGVLDEDADRGYWLPVDATANRRARWVSNATITDTLKTLQAKHVMLIADSCYSGTLTRSAAIGLRSGDYFRRMAKKWARVAMVSGGLEPVADKGGGGHSPFAKALIEALQGNQEKVLDGTQLFNTIRRPVMVSADQTPEYSDVRNAGHDGGDFLFVRKE